jgi:Fe2+ transport protein
MAGMSMPRRLASVVAVLSIAVAAAGCAKADKSGSPTASASTSTSGSSAMAGMKMGGESSSGGSGSGMKMGGSSGAGMSVDGIKPIPTQMLASTTWEGMKITARAMTAVPFVIYNGTQEKLVKPGPRTSFHLMVDLNDAHTGVPIPYATVWATISKNGRIYYDDRQWPMIAEYMGPHYGNDVSVPGAGTYQLSLLVSPPVSARHLEYQNVWTKPHRVDFQFHWNPPS